MTAPFPPVPAPLAQDDTPEDWDILFSAVIAKLRLIVGDLPPGSTTARLQDAAAPVRTAVLDCAAALDQLRPLIEHRMLQPGKAL